MPFDEDLDARMLREEGRVILDSWRLVGAEDIFIVIEENVFDVLAEQLPARGGRRCLGDGRVYRDAGGDVFRSSRPLRDQGVGSGFSRRHRPGTGRRQRAESAYANFIGIAGLPRQYG